MNFERFVRAPPEGIHARIGPHVAAISAVQALLNVVFVLSGAGPKYADEFMWASVETSLTRIGLDPQEEVKNAP